MRSQPSLYTLKGGVSDDVLSRYLESLRFTVNGFGHQHDNPRAEADSRIIGDIELILYRGGVGRVTVGGASYRCEEGDLVVIPPFSVHEIRTTASDPHDNFWIHFDVVPLYERDRLLSLLIPEGVEPRRPVGTGSAIGLHLDLLAQELLERRPGTATAAGACLRLLVLAVIRDAGANLGEIGLSVVDEPERTHLDRAIDYAIRNLSREIAIDDLANAAGTSRTLLFEIFRERFGQPPMALVRWMRLREAEILLKTTSLTVAEISARVGFASPFHLSRLFKERYGVGPQAYRATAH